MKASVTFKTKNLQSLSGRGKNERLLPDVKEPLFSLFYPFNDKRARDSWRANFVFKQTANWRVLPAPQGQ